MGYVIWTIVIAATAPLIEPVGAPPAIRFGADRRAHHLGQDGLVLQ